MLKKLVLLIALLCLSSCINKKKVEIQPYTQTKPTKSLKNNIREINYISRIKEITNHYLSLGYCPEDILTIFDVDETLLASYAQQDSITKQIITSNLFGYLAKTMLLKNLPPEQLRHIDIENITMANPKDFEQYIDKSIINAVKKKTYNMVVTLYETKHLKTVAESETISIINQLQKKGIKTMGLTARGVGLSEVTLEQLCDAGIQLSKNSIYPCKHMLSPLHGFINGILFTTPGVATFDKGKLLTQFFEDICYCPRIIIFTDDNHPWVESVQTALLDKYPEAIFEGFWYRGLKKDIVFDKKFTEEFIKSVFGDNWWQLDELNNLNTSEIQKALSKMSSDQPNK